MSGEIGTGARRTAGSAHCWRARATPSTQLGPSPRPLGCHNCPTQLPPEACPTPDEIRARYSSDMPALRAALDPALIAHRDRIFERHIGLPLDF